MSPQPTYACDTEFLKLLTRRSTIDLTLVALELARDAYPGLDFRPTLKWLDDRARELAGVVARTRSDVDALQALSDCLAEQHGIYGDANSYDSADSCHLNRVIETRRGLPITLSLLYMAVAQRLGIDLRGVSAPKHFLSRYESVDGTLFVDAFSRGRILAQPECTGWLCEITGLKRVEVRAALKPARPRTIVIRMLNNLKAIHARHENWPAAWIVQHRLAALQPCSYQERRDLGVISLRANRPGSAIDLLQSCLKMCPCDEKPALERNLEAARAQVCRWN